MEVMAIADGYVYYAGTNGRITIKAPIQYVQVT